jgi:hypothetical protein
MVKDTIRLPEALVHRAKVPCSFPNRTRKKDRFSFDYHLE